MKSSRSLVTATRTDVTQISRIPKPGSLTPLEAKDAGSMAQPTALSTIKPTLTRFLPDRVAVRAGCRHLCREGVGWMIAQACIRLSVIIRPIQCAEAGARALSRWHSMNLKLDASKRRWRRSWRSIGHCRRFGPSSTWAIMARRAWRNRPSAFREDHIRAHAAAVARVLETRRPSLARLSASPHRRNLRCVPIACRARRACVLLRLSLQQRPRSMVVSVVNPAISCRSPGKRNARTRDGRMHVSSNIPGAALGLTRASYVLRESRL